MKVLFKYHEEDKELFAYFPNDIADRSGDRTSYAHIGQHSACSKEYANESRSATKEEYENLLEELISRGYDNLHIINEENDNGREFTFDVIRRDSFPTLILVRYANESDATGDKFDDLKSCLKSVEKKMKMNVFVSTEILNNLL